MTDKQIIDKPKENKCKFISTTGQCLSPINKSAKYCNEIPEEWCYYKQLKRKEQECKALRKDIKDIANLLDLDTGEEYNFGNIELEIKQLKVKEQECFELQKTANAYNYLVKLANYRLDKIEELKQQLDQLKSEKDELKKVNLHIENNRKQKADKLMRIEKLIIACLTGYTDEFIQELLVILHEPEPVSFENKYKTILAEIKGIAEENDDLLRGYHKEWANNKLILQKISECEGNDRNDNEKDVLINNDN